MEKYTKEFDKWNICKKEINNNETIRLYKEREIWWASVGVNVGYEEDGKNNNYVRPVLIIRKFNRMLFLGIPMSTRIKDNKYYYNICIKGKTVSLLLSQIKVFSSKRLLNRHTIVNKNEYKKIIDYLIKNVISRSL